MPESDAEGAPVELSDRRTRRVGFRQVAMRGWTPRSTASACSSRGRPTARPGPPWPRPPPTRSGRDVARAVDGGLDLLRVHSHIGHPELYDAADEAGLLLWQDLPLHGGYARTLRKQAMRQAREAVDLLGHHPSVAIWCGHDEPFPVEVDPEIGPVPASMGRTALRQQVPSWNASVLDRSIKRTLQTPGRDPPRRRPLRRGARTRPSSTAPTPT